MLAFKLHSCLERSLFRCSMEVFALLLCLIAIASCETCTFINSCECHFQNGSVIDLHQLGNHREARWEKMIPEHSDKQYRYYYNPCYDVEIGNYDCSQGVAGCQVHENSTMFYSLGDQKSAHFVMNTTSETLHLIYSTHERTLNVTLHCDPHAKDASLIVQGEVHAKLYEMTLTSRCACVDLCVEKGLSTGSVLVVIFLVFTCLYLFLGIAYNKAVRGASGWELIPNYDFWQDLPLLVRDGCVFVSSGCKAETTYERI